MPSKEKFKNYTAIQLATDVDFISWVKWPDEAGNLFWEEYIKNYPSQKAAFEKARTIVSKMHIVHPSLNEHNAENTWEKIVKEIEAEIAPETPRTISIYRNWMVAAAMFIFLVGGATYFLLQNRSADNLVVNTPANISYDIAPGGNVATLTLSDGSTISLDSVNNGSLAQQGQSTIIKLEDGQLAYKEDGHKATLKEVQYNTVSTPRGGQYQLVLADGSKVWLNAASSIRFPAAFIGKERDVEITGEVYFEVAHNASKPFIVKANGVDIKVLGTSFNVNAYEDESTIKTTLLEGSVEVSMGRGNSFLKPGDQAVVSDKSDKILVNKNANIEEVVAWKNGLFYFDEDNVETVMKKIARWYDVDVEIKGTSSDKKFNGKLFRDVELSQIVKILEEGGIKVNIAGKKMIVTK